MNDLERYLDSICRGIAGPRALRRHMREELRGHVEEAAERHRATGVEPDEALRRAIEEFGEAGEVSDELEAVYGRRLIAFLVEKTTEWKERAMRAEYRWTFVAAASTLSTIVVGVLMVLATEVFIVPKLMQSYHEAGEPLPEFAWQTWNFLLPATTSSIVWTPVLVLGAVLFEWRYKGKHKSVVRFAGGTLACFGVMVVVVAAAAATVIPLALLPGYATAQRIGPAVVQRAVAAQSAMVELEQAVAAEDRRAALQASQRLREDLGSLRRSPPLDVLLTGWVSKERLENAKRTFDMTAESLERLCDDLRDEDSTELAQQLAELRLTFDAIRSNARGWPENPPEEAK